MQTVIGSKNLNLEELFTCAYLPGLSQVVVDSAISAEFAASAPGGAPKEAQSIPEIPAEVAVNIRPEHERAILLVKLAQIVKLKKNALKPNVEFLVSVLNSGRTFGGPHLFKGLFDAAR